MAVELSVCSGAETAEVEPTVVVVGVAPLPGAGAEIEKIPHAVQGLSADELSRSDAPSFTAALGDRLAGVIVANNLDDPFQPDILYRGFAASPVVGTPQGLAVYQNGVRINEAFGDALDWDLIPDLAIHRVTLTANDPVYGLNALGGALVLDMKSGFSAPGGEASLSGGAFGRREAALQFGAHADRWGIYVAARSFNQDGWRAFSPDAVRQAYASASLRQDRVTADISLTLADNHLSGESPAPVQELAVSRRLVFTSPQSNHNQLVFLNAGATWRLAPWLNASGLAYVRDFRQAVVNGNTTDYERCAENSAAGLLCQPNGVTPLIGRSGQPISDISHAGATPIGELDLAQIHSRGEGVVMQFAATTPVAGRANRLVLGAGFDQAPSDFATQAEVGVVDAALRVLDQGLFVVTPEAAGFNATPVGLSSVTRALGIYATDSLDLSRQMTLTVSGRYNLQRLGLTDHNGDQLTGGGRYERFNPSVGVTEQLTPGLTAYAQYSETNRAPTASEIECSDPARPCLLPSSLAGDPPNLRQVVAHAFEAGLRGRWPRLGVTWRAALFRTDLNDDIYGVATSLSGGYFRNIGATRRQGAEVGFGYRHGPVSIQLDYSYLDATFRSPLTVPSPANPLADADGDVAVQPGDRLPGLPRHQFKADLDWSTGASLTLSADLIVQGEQVYGGDPSNLLRPLPGFAVVNLQADWRVSRRASLFAELRNVFDARCATLGVLGDPTGVGAPGVPNNGGADPRFQSPAAPISLSGGLRLSF
ncbi:MAG TPA: TonB-dependent receptor [Caulobacteraceae bacterium]|jgi:iron complex outermembrane receptor protein